MTRSLPRFCQQPPSSAISIIQLAAFLLIFAVSAFAQGASPQTPPAAFRGYTGIFGGGPFYKTANFDVSKNITELEHAGYSEAIVWSVEVNSAGDLNFNGEFPLTQNGIYVGNKTHPNFAANMARLKAAGIVKRITFSIGSSNYGDWENITNLVQTQGVGPKSVLYKDFLALKKQIPALDALDFDDENSYNLPTTVKFGVMVGKLGYHVMPDPYVDASYWQSVVSEINKQLPGTVDGVHLQAYAGGGGNSPCSGWDFGDVPVLPGVWDKDYTPPQVESVMSSWHKECGILGGFMWIYDDFVLNGLAKKYATAINQGVK
ncbi:MAG TPA: hypothetical protein VF753_12450 [Terriglobales bacterium]